MGKIANVFRLKNAEQVRKDQTTKMQKKVKKLYEDVANDIHKELQKKNDTITQVQLTLLQRDIEQRIKQVTNEIATGITDSMITTSNMVVEDTRIFLINCGFKRADIAKAFLYIPDNVVRNIVTGNVYEKNWSLSTAIWGHTKDFNDKLSEIIAHGVAQGKSAYDIAKDLETYVNPALAKPQKRIDSWIYKTDKKGNFVLDAQGNRIKIKKSFFPGVVDYNAMRLARTMISHAYQQSFMAVNEKDPFVTGYRWLTSNFHGRVCDICKERAETNHHGLGEGVFPKDDLPMDHPNGMCVFEAVLIDDIENIGTTIGNWYNAPPGTYPAIDAFAADIIREFDL